MRRNGRVLYAKRSSASLVTMVRGLPHRVRLLILARMVQQRDTLNCPPQAWTYNLPACDSELDQ